MAETIIDHLGHCGAKVDDALDILSVVASAIIHTYCGKEVFQLNAAARFANSMFLHIKKLNLDF